MADNEINHQFSRPCRPGRFVRSQLKRAIPSHNKSRLVQRTRRLRKSSAGRDAHRSARGHLPNLERRKVEPEINALAKVAQNSTATPADSPLGITPGPAKKSQLGAATDKATDLDAYGRVDNAGKSRRVLPVHAEAVLCQTQTPAYRNGQRRAAQDWTVTGHCRGGSLTPPSSPLVGLSHPALLTDLLVGPDPALLTDRRSPGRRH